MTLTERENFLRTIEFRGPEWIPLTVGILPAAWMKHRDDLEEIVAAHPRVFGPHDRGDTDFDDLRAQHQEYRRDEWGCLWHNLEPGILGQVIEHPLADWNGLDDLQVPDPDRAAGNGGTDWAQLAAKVQQQKELGQPATGSAGFVMEVFVGLRGFENLMTDVATRSHQLQWLIDIVLEQKLRLIQHWLDLEVDLVGFHSDIGTQRGPMFSPAHFRETFKPMYKTMFQTCRDAGAHVFYSSDGNLLELMDDLIECGVTVHDPQVRANGLDAIVNTYKGRLCAKVDLDQQQILPFGTPAEVNAHVREVVRAMDAPEGGLMIFAEIQAAYPLANIEALCVALEKYCLDRMA